MISVVIPVFNEEKFLPDCLHSLQHQDYHDDYEVIVVDNGSTDCTARIARHFGVRVIPCPERSVFSARQAGADAACGDIIAQADADTIYPPDWIKQINDLFTLHPQVVAVTGRFVYRDASWWAGIECAGRHIINRITALFGCPLVPSGATLAFRRQAFLSVDGYRDLSYSQDQYGILKRLSQLGKVAYNKNLKVSTSSRSVQKPVLRVIKDLLSHIMTWSEYSFRNQKRPFGYFAGKKPVKRLAMSLLVISILLISFGAYGYFVPGSSVFGKVYSEGNPANKVVALTFDDGPNDPYTSQILDILAKYHIHATFFLIGKNVQLYPETARRILADGNVIGNHSYSHNANHALTEYGAADLKKAEQVIFNVTGVSPHLYSPPHGKKSPWELEAVKDEGMIEVTWSVSANDQHVLAYFGKPTPEMFASEIVRRTEPGSIILLHDGYGLSHNILKADRSLTVKALELIIQQLQAKGYRFVTVPEMLKAPAYDNSVSP